MNVHLALTCALPEGRIRAGGRMRTGSEPWCKGLTFSRDRPLLLLRLLTGPDRLGPALRTAVTLRTCSHKGGFGAHPPMAARRQSRWSRDARRSSHSGLVDPGGTQLCEIVPSTANERHAAVVPGAWPDCRNSAASDVSGTPSSSGTTMAKQSRRCRSGIP